MTDREAPDQSGGVAASTEPSREGVRVGASIERWIEEHGDFVHRFLRRLGVSEADVEDEAIEVFYRAHVRIGDYDPTKPARPWIAGFAVRVASESRRRARARPSASVDGHDPVEPRRGPEELAADAERRERLAAALDRLADEQRTVLVMAFVEGMTMPEIAEILGIPLNTGYSRLRLARDALKVALADLRPTSPRGDR